MLNNNIVYVGLDVRLPNVWDRSMLFAPAHSFAPRLVNAFALEIAVRAAVVKFFAVCAAVAGFADHTTFGRELGHYSSILAPGKQDEGGLTFLLASLARARGVARTWWGDHDTRSSCRGSGRGSRGLWAEGDCSITGPKQVVIAAIIVLAAARVAGAVPFGRAVV